MSDIEPTGADHIGARLRLICPKRHDVGRLRMRGRGQNWIEYKRAGQPDPPDFWRLDRADFYSEPVCPGGCRYEVGAPADQLVQRIIALANDMTSDEDTFTLTFIGPAQTSD